MLVLSLRKSAGNALYGYGRLVARHPLKIMLIGLVVLGGLAVGIARGGPDETRSAHLWTPTSSKAFRDWRVYEETFGEDKPKLVIYLRPTDGSNALKHKIFKQALMAHDYTVKTCEATAGGKKLTFDSVCDKYPQADDCAVSNFLTLWGYDGAKLDLMESYGVIPLMLNALHQVVNASTFAGGLHFAKDDTTGKQTLKNASALALIYTLNNASTDVRAFERAWNAGIADAVDSNIVQLTHVSPAAVDDAIAESAAADMPKLMFVVIILVVLLVVALGSAISCTRSRILLGVAATGVGALSLAAGYGMCELAKVTFNSMASLQLLLLLAAHVSAPRRRCSAATQVAACPLSVSSTHAFACMTQPRAPLTSPLPHRPRQCLCSLIHLQRSLTPCLSKSASAGPCATPAWVSSLDNLQRLPLRSLA